MRRPLAATLLWCNVAAGCSCASAPGSTSQAARLLVDQPEVAHQSLDGFTIVCPWRLENTSAGPATLEAISWRLLIGNAPPQEGRTEPQASFVPGSKIADELRIQTTTSPEEGLGRANPKPLLPYVVEAVFALASGHGAEEVIAKWEGDLLVPKPLAVVLTPKAERSNGALGLSVTISIRNPNAFGVQIESLDYVLSLEGEEVSRGRLARNKKLSANAELQFDITRFVGRDDLYGLAQQLLGKSAFSYQFAGRLRADGELMASEVAGIIRLAK